MRAFVLGLAAASMAVPVIPAPAMAKGYYGKVWRDSQGRLRCKRCDGTTGLIIGAGIGALIGSEFLIATQAYGPVWDGLALVPALIGGLIVGVIVELATRYATGGTYTAHRPMSA